MFLLSWGDAVGSTAACQLQGVDRWQVGFLLLTPNSYFMSEQKSSFIRSHDVFRSSSVRSGKHVLTVPWDSRSWLIPVEEMRSSAFVAYKPQGLICCTFWHAFHLTMVVKNGYAVWKTVALLLAWTSLDILTVLSTKHFYPQSCQNWMGLPPFLALFWCLMEMLT